MDYFPFQKYDICHPNPIKFQSIIFLKMGTLLHHQPAIDQLWFWGCPGLVVDDWYRYDDMVDEIWYIWHGDHQQTPTSVSTNQKINPAFCSFRCYFSIIFHAFPMAFLSSPGRVWSARRRQRQGEREVFGALGRPRPAGTRQLGSEPGGSCSIARASVIIDGH